MATLKSLHEEGEKFKSSQQTKDSNITNNTSQALKRPSSSIEEETRKRKLLKIAPKLPFDIDLYHWEDKDLKAPSIEMYYYY